MTGYESIPNKFEFYNCASILINKYQNFVDTVERETTTPQTSVQVPAISL